MGAPQEWEHGTIRDNAVYAWPYTPEFTERELSWSDSSDNDYVIVELPEPDIRISSYEFIWALGETEQTNFTIPKEKYEPELTFDVDAFRRTVGQFNAPCAPSELLV